MRFISVKIMVISVRQEKKIFCQHVAQPVLKMKNFLLDMRKDFLIMSNFYLVEILSEPDSLTIVRSKKYSKWAIMSSFEYFLSRNENQEFALHVWKKFGNLVCSKKNNFLYLRWKLNLLLHVFLCKQTIFVISLMTLTSLMTPSFETIIAPPNNLN